MTSIEEYKGNGEYKTQDGRNKVVRTLTERASFLKRNDVNQEFITSEDASVIEHVLPIMVYLSTDGDSTDAPGMSYSSKVR